MRVTSLLLVLLIGGAAVAEAKEKPGAISIATEEGRVVFRDKNRSIATYVYNDPLIIRPYFAHVKAPGNIPLTRNHPPVAGKDATDHATFHPGLWMAFGDLSGADSWRLKALVRHESLVENPKIGPNAGTFAVRNSYLSQDGKRVLARETCRFTLHKRPVGYFLLWDSQLTPADGELALGDQEEMGLGVRVATPLTVANGGEITDSEDRKNEAQIRGKAPRWCDYSGTVGNRRFGVTLMQDPRNFRESWIHARDYGFFAFNPFGRQALTGGERSQVVVRPGESLRLRYGILLHSAPQGKPVDLNAAYEEFQRLSAE